MGPMLPLNSWRGAARKGSQGVLANSLSVVRPYRPTSVSESGPIQRGARGSGLQPRPLVGWRGEGLVLGTEAPSVGISTGRHREEAGSAYLEWRGW